MLEHVKTNAINYILLTVLAPLVLGGFFALMDARHDAIGSSVKSELRSVKRALRQQKSLQTMAPSETYGPYREVEIFALEDEVSELEQELAEMTQ